MSRTIRINRANQSSLQPLSLSVIAPALQAINATYIYQDSSSDFRLELEEVPNVSGTNWEAHFSVTKPNRPTRKWRIQYEASDLQDAETVLREIAQTDQAPEGLAEVLGKSSHFSRPAEDFSKTFESAFKPLESAFKPLQSAFEPFESAFFKKPWKSAFKSWKSAFKPWKSSFQL